MRRSLFFFLALFLVGLGLAQEVCRYCRGSLDLQPFSYRDGVYQVCSKCRASLPACSLCTNPCPQPAYRDGRYICPSCKKTGMFDKARVETLSRAVVKYMIDMLGAEAKTLPPIQLVDYDEMRTKFNQGGRNADVVAFYQPYNPELVYLLTGETEVESGSHLAHELTHAWESRACIQQDRALSEGMACWVQYQYLMNGGHSAEAQKITRHSDPDYGASLVYLLGRSRALGNAAFIAKVRKSRNLKDV
ncbi:MAG: hypothetical protein U0931_18715 [Vulcanimicrobiota bacterium]